MNVPKFFQLLLICVLFVGLSACDKGINTSSVANDAALSHIPSEVSSVTAINIGQMMKKADFESIKKMEFFEEVVSKAKEENAAMAEILMNPYKSGIDLKKNAYSTMNIDPNDPEQMFASITFSLSDAKAFATMLSNAGMDDVADKGTHKQIMKDNVIIAWNDEIAVIGGGDNGPMLWQGAAKHFTTTDEQSVSKNKDLLEALSGDHDVSNWVTSNNFADNEMAKMALSMMNIPGDALKDNFIHGYMDFEDGNIKGVSKYFLQKGLTKDLDLFFKDNVKTDFSPFIPADNLVSAMTVALDIKGIKQVLSERPQFNSMAGFALKEYDLTIDDLVKAFNGDMMLALMGEKKNMGGLFATRIDDMDVLKKLLDVGITMGIIKENGSDSYLIKNANKGASSMGMGSKNPDGIILLKDDKVFISGDEALIDKVRNGGFDKSERLPKDQIKKLTGNIFSGFLNMAAVSNIMPEDDRIQLPLDKIEFNTDRKAGLFEAQFKDKNTNSLKQLFEMINQVYLKSEKDKEKWQNDEAEATNEDAI